jgi:hypothetical protein
VPDPDDSLPLRPDPPAPERTAPMLVHWTFPNDNPVLTRDAIAGLIGQEPHFLRIPGDYRSTMGRARITDAYFGINGVVVVALEVPERAAAMLEPTVRASDPVHYSLGWGGIPKDARREGTDRVVGGLDMKAVWGDPEPALRVEMPDLDARTRRLLADVREQADQARALADEGVQVPCQHPRGLKPGPTPGTVIQEPCSWCPPAGPPKAVKAMVDAPERPGLMAPLEDALRAAYRSGYVAADNGHDVDDGIDDAVLVALAGLGFDVA